MPDFPFIRRSIINFKIKFCINYFDDDTFRVMKNVHQFPLLNLAARQISNQYKKMNP